MKSVAFPLLWAAVLIPLLSARSAPLFSQESPGQSGGLRPNEATRSESDRERRARDLREREFNLRMAEKAGRQTGRREGPSELDVTRIKEDFRRLQKINSELQGTAAANGTMDLRFVTRSAAEIRKLAGRLQENLALPEPERGEKSAPEREAAERPIGEEGLRSALVSLNKLVIAFAGNPLFRHAAVFDAALAVQAGRDLKEIREISERVKKSSERLARGLP